MLGSADPFLKCYTWIIFHHSCRVYSNLCGLFISNLNCTPPSGLSNRPSGHGQKAFFFFLWQSKTPPQIKVEMGFCHKHGDFTLNTMKNCDFFFTFNLSDFTRGYDRCLLVCSQSTCFFLSVDINHLPFTINQFFLTGFYISLGYHCLLVCTSDLC